VSTPASALDARFFSGNYIEHFDPDAATCSTSTTSSSDGSSGTAAEDLKDFVRKYVKMAVETNKKYGTPYETVLAQGVIDAQGPEIDRMNAMLEAWGQQPVTDSGGMGTMDEMGGMDHGEMGGMSGMMSQEDMTALEEAQGTEAARLYLEQMTAHHEGAVDMARDEVADGQNPHAITLAEQIINDQEAEIAQMQQMLTDL